MGCAGSLYLSSYKVWSSKKSALTCKNPSTLSICFRIRLR